EGEDRSTHAIARSHCQVCAGCPASANRDPSPTRAERRRPLPVALDLDGLLVGRAVDPRDQRLGARAQRPEADRVEAHLIAVLAADAPRVVIEAAPRYRQGLTQR